MSVHLYMDVHVRRAITAGLRLRGVDVLIAQEDGTGELPDLELLDLATELDSVDGLERMGRARGIPRKRVGKKPIDDVLPRRGQSQYMRRTRLLQVQALRITCD